MSKANARRGRVRGWSPRRWITLRCRGAARARPAWPRMGGPSSRTRSGREKPPLRSVAWLERSRWGKRWVAAWLAPQVARSGSADHRVRADRDRAGLGRDMQLKAGSQPRTVERNPAELGVDHATGDEYRERVAHAIAVVPVIARGVRSGRGWLGTHRSASGRRIAGAVHWWCSRRSSSDGAGRARRRWFGTDNRSVNE